MRTLTRLPLFLTLLLTLLVVPCPRASAQDAEPAEGARIESADVSGMALDQLSPGLRRDIDTLTGDPLERERLNRLARRIEEEHPEMVAAVRIVARPDGQARVVFLAARISDDRDLVENINARYTVESVEIHGVPDADISAALRDRLQALVGRQLDPGEAGALREELEAEKPGFDVRRRMSRGSRPGEIRVVFEFAESERLRWIPFVPTRSKFVYHSDAGWSGLLDIPMGGRNHRATLGFAFDDNDDLIEEYSGARLRFESRTIGTERLGASLEVSGFRDTWRSETLSALAANPGIPEAYRARVTVDPSVTVAFTRQLRATGGVSVSSLESLSQSPESQMASAFVGSLGYRQRWNESASKQSVDASYELRASATGLGSDLTYKRHFGHARYRFDHDHNTIVADVFLGRITGRAPLFERFALGDTSTLRGWNKFAIAPAGGDHVFHQSLEYRFYGAALFLDTGSVWDGGTDKRMRVSTGFGFQTDHAFATVAFPLSAPGSGATFMMGVRF